MPIGITSTITMIMRMARITTIMTETQALQRLLAWTSPAFPIGAFAYSAGLESMIAERRITDSSATRNWIEGNLRSGTARNDAILVVEASHRHAEQAELQELADLCLALTPARQRREEMLVMGTAFVAAVRAWADPVHERLPDSCPYPVAFGAIAGEAGIDPAAMLTAFLTSHVQAQISVAVRLVPIGQTDGLAILAVLEPLVGALAVEIAGMTIDDLGSAAYAADIAAMAHETLSTRIFRS